jgi:hypothetical integral membrane protein (TIGR02206 family)
MTQVSFWTFLKDQSEYGSGFATFGTEHLSFLAGIAVFLAASCVFYRRSSGLVRNRFFRVWALVIFAMELLKQIILIASIHPYPVTELPLNLCGLFIFIGVFHAFKPSKITGELFYALNLPAAIAALLTPDWTRYPVFNYFSLHAFIIHGLLLGVPLLLLAGNQMRPNFKNLWKVAICLAVAVGSIGSLNNVIHTNFMFLSWPAKGTPLEIFDLWFGSLGSHGYLLGLVLLLITLWLIEYLPWLFADLRKKRTPDLVRLGE